MDTDSLLEIRLGLCLIHDRVPFLSRLMSVFFPVTAFGYARSFAGYRIIGDIIWQIARFDVSRLLSLDSTVSRNQVPLSLLLNRMMRMPSDVEREKGFWSLPTVDIPERALK
jgi:hypothetical protein